MFDLDGYIRRWRRSLSGWGIGKDRLDELEEHLRSAIEIRVNQGATSKEAFITARRALGDVHELKREFRKETLARILDSVSGTVFSYRALRLIALVSLLWAIGLMVALQYSPREVLFRLHPALGPSIWFTTIVAALVVWVSLSNIPDRTQKWILRAVLVATVTLSILLLNSPNTLGWSGASWIYIGCGISLHSGEGSARLGIDDAVSRSAGLDSDCNTDLCPSAVWVPGQIN